MARNLLNHFEMSREASAFLSDEIKAQGLPRLRMVAAAVVLLVPLAALYAPVLKDMVAQWWDDPNYAHCFLVPLFSGFLVWQRRRQLAALAPAGSPAGFVLLLGGVGALALGEIGADNFLTRSSLIVVFAGLVLYHLGRAVFRLLAFPIAFLLFMIPLPAILFYAMTFPLQRLAAQNGARVLHLLGVPAQLDGNIIHLSQVTLGVSEACSGVRSLITLIVVAVALAYLRQPGVWARLVLIASAVPITIAANLGRVVATALIAEWFGPVWAAGFFHFVAGWLIFVTATIALLGVHGLLRMGRPVAQRSI